MQPEKNLLAIDTSTTFLSLALQAKGKLYTYHEEVGNQQSSYILPQISALLAQAQCIVADLDAIVYAQGAGAFTGLRIGIGVAQGLATPFNTPLIGIPCQDAVAYLQPENECVLAATDARMNEVFYAFFDTKNHKRLSPYQVGKPEDITQPENYRAEQVIGVGNAFALPNAPQFSGSAQMPTAADYLALAQTERYTATAPEHAELLYVRDKIALTAAEQSAKKFQAA
ncbi:tRNA (adenosine(37)-N6)-threonylcarbamoyltransferase complex dimerization subunit type 1 TsaB [Kingella negevensis]|uniref:tRNA (adenosine(37)-N6)-threonylcarbamoyltransferase complex dimerization subunit type 1 TsaB n=1 Tax=Kingella negevensis TaxID=1522312 RepID=UPI00050A2E12|nr:tRNA (adenosine(37)-N6)-threonylcarbamoyltransferase complex dimerization subunit type 1 TsaB [Kingella negevensis]MDK4688933.1 tRNA (adenosine(37)-N6)-threonylcarbamoyltransferase complex dimerization subunit type 1 TsaB [Kingella negevensis]WII92012.1 tRNA (adenosine(37)-N6)-threonylcarbamoyltransferase complex dimerization subunit type 1 TsaB [Kingella negevensis]WII92238.1 tRNA (adenosine(37)-N6)-threonylcarbamoyltransferase complex dimerization subunit type 1 TsaB [Kingella negevensis]